MKTRIYTLHDQNDNIRYVGKTINYISSRLSDHIYKATHGKHKDHCGNWIRKCIADGFRPTVKLQEEVDGDGSCEEKYWIWFYRTIGYNLTNISSGGEGNPGRKISEETRMKLSLAKLGKKRMKGLTRKCKPHSIDHIANIKAAKQNISQETRDKIRGYRLGKKMSDEQKDKIRQANIGKTISLEIRSKIGKSNVGKHKSPTWLHENYVCGKLISKTSEVPECAY